MTAINSKSNDNITNGKEKSRPFSFYWIYLIIIAGVVLFNFFPGKSSSFQETTWQKFKQEMLLDHDVEKAIVVNKERVEVYIKEESLKKEKHKTVAKGYFGSINHGPHYYFQIGSVDVFEKHLEEAQSQFSEQEKISVQYINAGKSWWLSLLGWLAPIGLLILFWYFILNKATSVPGGMGRSIFDFGKSSPEIYDKGKGNLITFKNVAGYEEAKTEVMEIVEFLKQPENFTRLGAKIPKGVLLVGAPGTGKTLMAKAVAGEAGVPFFSLSGSEFIEMFVGVGASRVRDLFNKAKQKAPSIIFIDEIDTIGRVRGKVLSVQANDERDSTLNQLLAEMDGFGPNTGVIVLAATNRADILDPALLRAGRFDRHIHLDLPNKQERLAIFGVHLKPLVLDKSVDVEYLSSQTPGFSGADIANVCNEAALIAARKKKKAIEARDFSDAIDRIVSGLEKKSKIISPAEKKIIAYHEAGHAVVSWMLKNVDPLQKVSIIPHGKSLGASWYLPEERQIITEAQFFDRLCAALGGRTAEEIIFKEISSGALDDLERVTKQAYIMITQLGLNEKIGNISFYDSTGVNENSFQKPYSEATAQLIDEEVRILVKQAHESAKAILESNRDKLDTLAKLLLQKEVIYKKDIEQVLGKRVANKDKEENIV
ncbi:MAG: ATP-dependent metallopeptidase FtsH/Yme1/Tma family protein [Bacteroidetes bacterium]|nr:ATP-dependent metallopeptidase FtsH/Yme1/Tma family protein [Bacteroidota bacterium]